ncbi:MAG: hypothetical protein HY847_05465 [Betaproteobacteria bacterium]|nr:hypothetical protein [Betaproteobacteria bacterium]
MTVDACGFFQTLGDSVVTGPTLTNVNDFRAILIGLAMVHGGWRFMRPVGSAPMNYSDWVGGELGRWRNGMPILRRIIFLWLLRGWMLYSKLWLRCSYVTIK